MFMGTDEYSNGNELAKLLLISTSAADVEFTDCSVAVMSNMN